MSEIAHVPRSVVCACMLQCRQTPACSLFMVSANCSFVLSRLDRRAASRLKSSPPSSTKMSLCSAVRSMSTQPQDRPYFQNDASVCRKSAGTESPSECMQLLRLLARCVVPNGDCPAWLAAKMHERTAVAPCATAPAVTWDVEVRIERRDDHRHNTVCPDACDVGRTVSPSCRQPIGERLKAPRHWRDDVDRPSKISHADLRSRRLEP
jgi:hypothetical protein